MKKVRTYKASAWQRIISEVRYANKNGMFDAIAAGIATMGLIFVVVIGAAFFC